MKLIKSLLLGTAAGFAATAGVQAADLPSKKAAPVDYVRVCTIGSFTGFVIPGSDVCLKIGGFVRYQYTYAQPQHAFEYRGGPIGYNGARGLTTNNGSGQRAYASVKMDARTTTEYGLLRSFFDMRIGQLSGMAGSGGPDPFIDKAYIQFGPWSFGKFQSFFDFYADAYNNIGGLGSDTSVTGAAYTFNAGNGFFATIALEDRNNAILASPVIPTAFTPGFVPSGSATAFYGTNVINNNGYRVPDAVVQFLYDPGAAGWGSAQLTAAVHQARVGSGLGAFGLAAVNGGSVNDTKYGWAVQGGVKFNLGMLGAGDTAYVQAAYAEGALSYIGIGNGATNGGFTQNPTSNQIIGVDAIAVGPGASVKLSKGFNVLAAIDHYWTPSFDTALWGSYTKVNYNNGAVFGSVGLGVVPGVSVPDFDYFQAGVQATWVPVKGLKFAGTVNWFQVQKSSALQDYVTPVAGGTTYYTGKKDSNGVQAALRIQRDF